MSSPAQDNLPAESLTTEDVLTELALDLRWSFNHSADKLWALLDPELWDLTHNPWIVLQTASPEKLRTIVATPETQKLIADLHREKREAEQSAGWFQPRDERVRAVSKRIQTSTPRVIRMACGGSVSRRRE